MFGAGAATNGGGAGSPVPAAGSSPMISPAHAHAQAASTAHASALGPLALSGKPAAVVSSRWWVAEHLIDHLIAKVNDGRSPVENVFQEPGYKPQVDALYSFVLPDSTLPGAPNSVHAGAILQQLTPRYLDEYSTLAIADVIKKWLAAAAPIFPESVFSEAARVAQSGDKPGGLAQMVGRLDTDAQGILAQLMRMCLTITLSETRTKISRARLAHVLGPVLFRSPVSGDPMEVLRNVKNVNALVEDLIVNAPQLCAAGARHLAAGGRR
jgi:hypothetical protein